MKKIVFVILVFVFPHCLSMVKAQTVVDPGYWDDVDFSDTALISSKRLSDKMVSYFFSFTDGDEKRFDSLSVAGLALLLDRAKVNMRMYEYVLEFALNGFSSLGRDVVTEYLLNYPQLAEGEITVEEGLRLDSITEPYQKLKVGAEAPDFKGVTIDGKPYQLYGSQAKQIIVVFWSTDCEYCHDFLSEIRKHFDLKSDFELVTFSLADSEDDVRKSVKRMRLPGYHFYDDLRWESKAFLDYHITTTPTVFVLDENKSIMYKPYDWNDLKDWFKSSNMLH